MDKMYVVSLCWRGGLLGGELRLDDERLTYYTTKLTVPPEIRKMPLPYCRIKGVEKSKALFLPTVTIRMEDGREWKFLVFGRKSFLDNLETAMDAYRCSD